MELQTEARLAENEATFRDANEQIMKRAREYEFSDRVPFLCECGEPKCREILRLTLEEYEDVRSTGTRFFLVPGHEGVVDPSATIVSRTKEYVVIEKAGIAGEVAERRDPRQKAPDGR
jgi:hypothetical protein